MDEQLIELVTAPVSADAPAGENAKYEDEYEALVQEVGKLEAVTADGGVDWESVIDLSKGILKDKSKDILVSCYMAHGLYQKQGLNGLQSGITAIAKMMETYFDDMFPPPKRMKARANALNWLAEKTEPMISNLNPTVKDYEQFDGLLSGINDIQHLCDEKMGDNGPALGAFKRSVKNWRDHLKAEFDKAQQEKEKAEQAAAAPAPEAAPTPTPAPAPAPAVAPAPAAAPAASVNVAPVAPVADMASDKDVKAAIKSVQDVGRKIAQFKRETNPADPLAYSLLRTTVWMQLERLPPADNGVTALPEIDPDRQRLLQNLMDSGDFPTLLKGAEAAFCDSMFWLTAHRYTASALEALGHQQAHKAVIQSVASFLNTFPGVVDLKFNTGTPFLDDMTSLWIDEQVLASGGGSGGASGGASVNPWDTALQSALSMAGQGKLKEGVQEMQAQMNGATNERQRFMWNLAFGQLFTKTGNVARAVPQLEYLWKQMVTRDLCEWESDASLVLAKSLMTCYDNKDFKKEMNEERTARYQEVKSVVFRLDMESF